MNNWHRRVWKLDPIKPTSDLAELYLAGALNQFWFEPSVEGGQVRSFRVQFQNGAMAGNWADCTMTPQGSTPFNPQDALSDDTEQLAGTMVVGNVQKPLHVYLDATNGSELLRMLIGDDKAVGGGGGWATAQN